MRRFITPPGESIFALGVNYPLKVAAFDPGAPGCISPDRDKIAKRSDRIGALIASLPLVTVMVMIWLYVERQPTAKVANHAYYTFWYVMPTMPMFLLMPWMLRQGIGFWASLAAGCLLTVVSFTLAAVILRRFGIDLML